MRFWRNQEIEDLAEARLAQLQAHLGCPLKPPIPLDLVAEHCLGLDFLWDTIEELPGETIWGAICPRTRRIILNEKHRLTFSEKPGLERSTIGHEMGHWDLFLSKQQLDQPSLLVEPTSMRLAYRGSANGQVMVMKALITLPDGRELVRKMQSRADDPDEVRCVNRYAAALSMPKALIRAEAEEIDRTRWANLYRLAERFEVTISALRVRLEQMDLLALSEDGKTLYSSRSEASGQGSLF